MNFLSYPVPPHLWPKIVGACIAALAGFATSLLSISVPFSGATVALSSLAVFGAVSLAYLATSRLLRPFFHRSGEVSASDKEVSVPPLSTEHDSFGQSGDAPDSIGGESNGHHSK